jgi:hypothetical protein
VELMSIDIPDETGLKAMLDSVSAEVRSRGNQADSQIGPQCSRSHAQGSG